MINDIQSPLDLEVTTCACIDLIVNLIQLVLLSGRAGTVPHERENFGTRTNGSLLISKCYLTFYARRQSFIYKTDSAAEVL